VKASLIIALACFILSGCTREGLTEKAINHFDNKGITFHEDLKYCLIIPGGGCSGCIASGISFVKEMKEYFSINQNENAIIFTGIASNKILRRQLGGVTLDSMNVLIDTANVYTINTPDSRYPIVLYLKEGRVVRADKQSPESAALEELRMHLEKQI